MAYNFDRVGDLARLLLQSHLQRQRDDRLYEQDVQLGDIEAQRSAGEALLTAARDNPLVAQRLQEQGITEINGVPVQVYESSQAQREAPGREQIASATTMADLPSVQDALNTRLSEGRIGDTYVAPGETSSGEGLAQFTSTLRQLGDRRSAIAGAEAFETGLEGERAELAAYRGAQGTEQATAENFPAELDRFRQTEQVRTDFNIDQIAAANQLALETTRQLVQAYDAEGNPGFYYVGPNGQQLQIEGLLPELTTTAAGSGAGMGGEIGSIRNMLDEFNRLSGVINTSTGMNQLMQGGIRWGRSFLNQDDAATLYRVQKQPIALALASLINGGRPSDPDREATERMIPGFTTPEPVAERMIFNMYRLLDSYGLADASPQELQQLQESGAIPAFGIEGLQQELLRPIPEVPGGSNLPPLPPAGGADRPVGVVRQEP